MFHPDNHFLPPCPPRHGFDSIGVLATSASILAAWASPKFGDREIASWYYTYLTTTIFRFQILPQLNATPILRIVTIFVPLVIRSNCIECMHMFQPGRPRLGMHTVLLRSLLKVNEHDDITQPLPRQHF